MVHVVSRHPELVVAHPDPKLFAMKVLNRPYVFTAVDDAGVQYVHKGQLLHLPSKKDEILRLGAKNIKEAARLFLKIEHFGGVAAAAAAVEQKDMQRARTAAKSGKASAVYCLTSTFA